jgi:hypothetical protein
MAESANSVVNRRCAAAFLRGIDMMNLEAVLSARSLSFCDMRVLKSFRRRLHKLNAATSGALERFEPP